MILRLLMGAISRDDSLAQCIPDEVILKIFQLLDISDLYNASRACSRWRAVAGDRSLWTTPRIGSSRQDPKHVLCILQSMGCMSFIESLSLHCEMTEPVDDVLEETQLQCRHLKKLCLRGQTISDLYILGTLIISCRRLDELILDDTRTLSISKRLILYNDHIRNVERLCVSNCGFTVTIFILTIFRRMKNLQSLSIQVIPQYVVLLQNLITAHVNSLRIMSVVGTITGELLHLICSCAGLETLSLCADSIVITTKNLPKCIPFIVPAGLFVMPSSAAWSVCEMAFPYLEHLILEGMETLQDEVLERVANRCSQLQSCLILDCVAISNCGIQQILQKCTNLTHFQFCGKRRASDPCLLDLPTGNKITSVDVLPTVGHALSSYIVRMS